MLPLLDQQGHQTHVEGSIFYKTNKFSTEKKNTQHCKLHAIEAMIIPNFSNLQGEPKEN